MAATMSVNTHATVSVQWKDKAGNPAKVDGPTTWLSSDSATCEVAVAPGNPLIANLFAPGPIGKVQIHANADADLGSGVQPVTSSIDVEVISGEAVGGEITFSQSPAQGGPGTTGAKPPQAGQPGGGKPPQGAPPAGTPPTRSR